MIETSSRELATILAALHVWRCRNMPGSWLPDLESAESIARKHGPSLDAEELDKLAERLAIDWMEPVPELAGTCPVVLYLRDSKDRDELIAALKEAKPGMVTRKL